MGGGVLQNKFQMPSIIQICFPKHYKKDWEIFKKKFQQETCDCAIGTLKDSLTKKVIHIDLFCTSLIPGL